MTPRHIRELRTVSDWLKIIILPMHMATQVALHVYPIILVVEAVLCTLLVYWAVERRIKAHTNG